MKWIVIAILAFVAVYTALTLAFRKPGTAYQPYHDEKVRATAARLESAGFERITANVERPVEGAAPPPLTGDNTAQVQSAPGGVLPDLRDSLIDQPRLAASIDRVRAAEKVSRLLPYTVQFSCSLNDNKQLLSGAYVYVREQELAIVPEFEVMDGELLARTADSWVQVTIPGGTLQSGTYQVTLVGSQSSRQWALQVD